MFGFSQQQLAQFQAFGFVVVRGLLDDGETATLTGEVTAALTDAFGGIGTDTDPEGTGGIRGDYLPLSVDRAPLSQSLIADDPRLFQGSAALLGRPTVPTAPIATCFVSNAGWHTDQGPEVGGVKFLAHLERRTAGTGALRVIPGLPRPGLRGAGARLLVQGPGPAGVRRLAGPRCGAGDRTRRRDRLRPPPVTCLGRWPAASGVDDRVPPWPGLADPERLRVVRDLVVDAVDFDPEGDDRQRWPTWRKWEAGGRAVPSRQVAVERLGLLGVLGEGDPRCAPRIT